MVKKTQEKNVEQESDNGMLYACKCMLQHLHAADSCFIAIVATCSYHSDEEQCQGCQKRYIDDRSSDQECWVGCDLLEVVALLVCRSFGNARLYRGEYLEMSNMHQDLNCLYFNAAYILTACSSAIVPSPKRVISHFPEITELPHLNRALYFRFVCNNDAALVVLIKY